ncbi:Vmh family MBL fold metallo-hydrolase [Aliivibrio logei]|uniref:MBL fold metallo-hydrolase n=1 Tax=Aliivibrio logei TaxID=688 RepID=A0A1B9P152_ALILO|nr:Vmh family MBL fold metallo-hydrolase [Aliivibrio logei]OCH22035.1 MBL fold metallo-hydrolase [Aliivibrio logei]
MTTFSAITLTSALILTSYASAADLNISPYNPGKDGVFPTTSVLVSGEKEAILFDAQFSIKDGEALVHKIKKGNKKLSMIYISGGDPDYYFGLQPLVNAFPDVKVVASEAVVKHIKKTMDAKLAYWGPILGDGAPTKLIVPEVFNDKTLILDGKKIEVKEINTHQAYLWIPSTKVVFGGISVSSGMHVWTADSQTKEARHEWSQSLERMIKLDPEVIIPGHYLGDIPKKTEAVSFVINYLKHFEEALSQSNKSEDVIKMMKDLYPSLAGEEDLSLSAKVNTGEMEW